MHSFDTMRRAKGVKKSCGGVSMATATAGLRILLTIQDMSSEEGEEEGDSNILLLKTCLKVKPPSSSTSPCFLKSCFLCHNSLKLDEDVYMYRGDLGFCSVKCRDRQIFIDEMKEKEDSAKRILGSFRLHHRRCETDTLFEDFRGLHSRKNGGPILFSYS